MILVFADVFEEYILSSIFWQTVFSRAAGGLSPEATSSIEFTQPDIPHGDLARLTFDFEADQAGLVIDGVLVVIDENGH